MSLTPQKRRIENSLLVSQCQGASVHCLYRMHTETPKALREKSAVGMKGAEKIIPLVHQHRQVTVLPEF